MGQKIAVIGANGQLGSDIVEELTAKGETVIGLNHEDIEIADRDSVFKAISAHDPDVIINTAAFHNVEKCEEEPVQAYKGNGLAAKYLAEAAMEYDSYLIHISTDYVFDGGKKSPYVEEDLPLPLNVYSNTKLAGEYYIMANSNRYLIMRTCGLYGKNPCRAKGGRNFVETMLKLASERDEVRVVDDEVLTPTSTREVARQIAAIIDEKPVGVCHATAEGSCSWYEFAREIFTIMKSDVVLHKARPGEFPVKVNRPSYSVLENKFLKSRGLNILKPWKEGLREYLLEER